MRGASIGIIGGSGLYDMPALKDRDEITVDTPFGPPSDALILGMIAGHSVAFLPRHGRGHRLLPSEVPSRANMYALKTLGVERVISVSAVGSLREELPPGRLVVPDQLVDRTKGVRPFTFFGGGIAAHVPFAHPFCSELRGRLLVAANSAGEEVGKRGTYVVIEGPQFSTLAESEGYRTAGYQLVGMTALPEAKLAREAGLCYAILALITDYDCWHPDHDAVTVEAVMAVMQRNVVNAQAVIAAAVPLLDDTRGCACGQALENAIMTAPDLIPPDVRERLGPLIDPYLAPRTP
jgi:5'-methylthioadenosine phosphorylase